MNRQTFFSKVVETVSDEELLLVHHAYWLSKRTHQYQKRDNGERYFEHCRRVALILIGAGFGTTKVIIVALLHDCLEDGFIHPKIIEKIFGTEIADAIQTLSKTIPIFHKNGFLKERVPKNLSDYYKDISISPIWIRSIKLADRIDNLNNLENWSEDKKRKYVEETETHLLPVGIYTSPDLTLKLEELCEKIRTGPTSSLRTS